MTTGRGRPWIVVPVLNTTDPLDHFVTALSEGPRNVAALARELFAQDGHLEVTLTERVLRSRPDLFKAIGDYWILARSPA